MLSEQVTQRNLRLAENCKNLTFHVNSHHVDMVELVLVETFNFSLCSWLRVNVHVFDLSTETCKLIIFTSVVLATSHTCLFTCCILLYPLYLIMKILYN